MIPEAWRLEELSDTAAALHARDLAEGRTISVCRPTAPAIVLGSAQHDSDVDADAARQAGVDVVRRRGGGGAVWLAPEAQLWLDVVIPSDDRLWDDDVGRAFMWLGDVWARALVGLGVEASSYRGPLVRSAWSTLVCFAGLGPGEIHATGAKLVGVSQRRARTAARFQCVCYPDVDHAPMLDLLTRDVPERRLLAAELAATTVGLDDLADPAPSLDQVLEAVVSELPAD